MNMIKIEYIETKAENINFFEESDEGKSSHELNMWNRSFIRYKHLCHRNSTINNNVKTEVFAWSNSSDYFSFIENFGEEDQELDFRKYKYNEEHNITCKKTVEIL